MRAKFQTTLEEDMIKMLKMYAIEKNCNVNDILEKIIQEWFSNHSPKTKK
jgi:hypothetical protein